MSKRKETEESGGGKRFKNRHEVSFDLSQAIRGGDLEESKRIVRECQVEKDKSGNPLNTAVWEKTPLIIAAQSNQVSIIKWLFSSEEGGGRSLGFNNVLAKTSWGETALQIAANRGHPEAFQAIMNGLRDNEQQEMLNAVDDGGKTIFHSAASGGCLTIVWRLLSGEGGMLEFNKVLAKTDCGETVLHMAAQGGHLETCKMIVNSLRADNGERQDMLNAITSDGRTVLHFAGTRVTSWLLSDEEGGGRSLGFNKVLAKTKKGETVLHVAANCTNLECFLAVVKGLRDKELQEMINAVTNSGETILHFPAQHDSDRASNWPNSCRDDSREIVRWILSENGGRAAGFSLVTARTTGKLYTALHIAVLQESRTRTTILSHCTSEERMNLFLAVDKHGWTALHLAAQRYTVRIIDDLFTYPECAMIVNSKDHRGMTALHRALAVIRGLSDDRLRSPDSDCDSSENEETVKTLLGMRRCSFPWSSSTAKAIAATAAWVDPNIGLGL